VNLSWVCCNNERGSHIEQVVIMSTHYAAAETVDVRSNCSSLGNTGTRCGSSSTQPRSAHPLLGYFVLAVLAFAASSNNFRFWLYWPSALPGSNLPGFAPRTATTIPSPGNMVTVSRFQRPLAW